MSSPPNLLRTCALPTSVPIPRGTTRRRRPVEGRQIVAHGDVGNADKPWGAAVRGDTAVCVDPRISPQLFFEGLAAELVHRINSARRAAGLALEARPEIYVGVSGEAEWEAGSIFGASVQKQVLAGKLHIMLVREGQEGISFR